MIRGTIASFRQNETLVIICIQIAVMMMGMGIIAPIVPLYAQTFGVSITMIGFLITVFGLARLAINFPAGQLTDRIGRRRIMIIGPLLVFAGSLGFALSSEFWQLFIFRIVQGLGSALYMTGGLIVMADISSSENRAQMMSLYQGSLLIGASSGPVVGGFAAEHYGFRAPFYLFAILGLIGAAWTYFRLPETKAATSPRRGDGESRSAATPDGSGATTDKKAKGRSGVGALLSDWNFLAVSFVTLGVFFTRSGSQFSIIPLLGSNRLHLTEGQIGLALTVMGFLNLPTIYLAGQLADKLGRKAVIVPSSLLVAIALVTFTFSPNYAFFLLSAILHGLSTGIAGPVPAAYVADIAPKESYGAAMGLYRSFGDLGFVIGPVLLGWIADMAGLNWPLYFNAALMLAGALVFMVVAKETVTGTTKTASSSEAPRK